MTTMRALWVAMLTCTVAGCYEPVPPLPGETSAATGSSGQATTAASAGSTTGVAACEPADPSPTIDCGEGGSCSASTQACCFTFQNVAMPELACGCPDQCGPNASEFRCDGPEDCPQGEVCCAQFDTEGTVKASCSTLQACASSTGIPMCQDDGPCQSIDSDLWCFSNAKIGFLEFPPYMGLCFPDFYTPCMSESDCAMFENGTSCVRPDASTNSICAPACSTPDDCPAPKDMVSAQPLCAVVEGSVQSRCVFRCENLGQCAPDQVCEQAMVEGQMQTICLWPTTDGGSG